MSNRDCIECNGAGGNFGSACRPCMGTGNTLSSEDKEELEKAQAAEEAQIEADRKWNAQEDLKGKYAIEMEMFATLFLYGHLSDPMQAVSKPYCELATKLIVNGPYNFESKMCLRKLLEAKDCAVRAYVLEQSE